MYICKQLEKRKQYARYAAVLKCSKIQKGHSFKMQTFWTDVHTDFIHCFSV
jgi:hypothetical protein